ncbi:MAG: BspA family leucine-rich repeat surface protein [Polaribacter sp.]
MIFKQLLLILTLFAQISPKVFLDKNGITIKCNEAAKVGETYTFNNTSYLIVDNDLLKELVKNEESLENVVTTYVTDMSYLFYKNKKFNDNISHWDVSNVTSMSWMFGFCEEFNGDISNWNTENVEFFNDMFHGTKNFNSDLSKWNVSKGILFNGMFFESFFNKDINTWDVSSASNLSGMFDNALDFNKPLSNWDVSNVKLMGGMFAEAIKFNQDISMWDVSKVTDMTNMFRNAVKFEQDLSSWTPRIYITPKNFNFNSPVIGPEFKKSTNIYLPLIITVIIFMLIYFYTIYRFKKKEEFKEYNSIIKKLIHNKKINDHYLTKNDLDEIFDIQHLEYEKQKAKRSSLIKEINNYKPELINRVRDPGDKRSFLYKIDC